LSIIPGFRRNDTTTIFGGVTQYGAIQLIKMKRLMVGIIQGLSYL